MSTIYVVEIEASEIIADVFVNDIPVCTRGGTHGWAWNGPVNHYLVDGANELSIELNPIEDFGLMNTSRRPATNRSRYRAPPPIGAEVSAKLVQYPAGAISGGPDGLVRGELLWRTDDIQIGMMWPHVMGVEVTADYPGGATTWERADVVDLNNPDVHQGVGELLARLYHAIANQDHETWLDLHSSRLFDHDRLYGSARGTRRLMTMNEFTSSPQPSHPILEPLVIEPEHWRLCAGGRLIQCVDAEGEPVLKEATNEDGTYATYPAFVGRLDGRWLPLRT